MLRAKMKRLYVPPPNPPTIIQQFREKNRLSNEEAVKSYFDFLVKIKNRKLGLSERIMYCQLSFSLLEPLIKTTIEEYGKFDIIEIPALELAIRYFRDNGIRGQLLNIKDIIDYFPELAMWSRDIEEALEGLKKHS